MTIWGIFAYTAIPAGVLLTMLLLSEFTMLMKVQGSCPWECVQHFCRAKFTFFIIWAVQDCPHICTQLIAL